MTINLTAAIVVIGNEILSGRTQDTNTSWIAGKLSDKGIKLTEVRVVADVESAIIQAVNELRQRNTYLFTTGGIGPTHDDITTASIAKAIGVDFPVNAEARQILLNYYGSEDKLTDVRLSMARIPVGASLIENPVSGAPGYKIENVFVMAGVPHIMRSMLDGILPNLDGGHPYLSNSVTCNLLESEIAVDLKAIQDKYSMVDVGSYPHFRLGDLSLSLILRSTDNDILHAVTEDVIAMVRAHGEEPTAVSFKSVKP